MDFVETKPEQKDLSEHIDLFKMYEMLRELDRKPERKCSYCFIINTVFTTPTAEFDNHTLTNQGDRITLLRKTLHHRNHRQHLCLDANIF